VALLLQAQGPCSSAYITNVRRAKHAVEAGQYRKAIQALVSEGLAQASPEVIEEMLSKYPQSPLSPVPASSILCDIVRALIYIP